MIKTSIFGDYDKRSKTLWCASFINCKSPVILCLRERAPAEEDPLSIFSKACRQQSDKIDFSVSSAFHQQLVPVDRLEDAAKFLSLHGVKHCLLSTLMDPA